MLPQSFFRRIKHNNTRFESGLKLFLSKFDMERLYDFEEEGIEGLMRSKEYEAAQNSDAKLKNLLDVSEEVKAKLCDLERWENITQESNHNLDFRYLFSCKTIYTVQNSLSTAVARTLTYLCHRNINALAFLLNSGPTGKISVPQISSIKEV